MLPLILALLATPQDPVTIRNPGLQESLDVPQNIEGLLINAPAKLEKLPETSPLFRSYQATITSSVGAQTGITQVITIVVTDLAKLETKPTPDQICDLHDRASRTRQNFAGQLFKSERTEINGLPMVVIVGSMLGRDNAQKEINIYHASAALSTSEKAFEITWISYYGGDTYTNAIKSVRSVSLQEGATTYQPKKLVGTAGNYSLLGVPFKFQLPKPTAASPEIKLNEGEKGRYLGQLSDSDWFATAEILVTESEIEDTSPTNLLKLLGYTEWAALEPKFELIDNIQVCKDLAITTDRHARIDIIADGNRVCAIIASTATDKTLPERSIIGLFQ